MRVESKTRRDEDEKTSKHLVKEISALKDALRAEQIVREDENKLIAQARSRTSSGGFAPVSCSFPLTRAFILAATGSAGA